MSNITFSANHQGCGKKEVVDNNIDSTCLVSIDDVYCNLQESLSSLEEYYKYNPSKEIYDKIILLERVINL